MEQLKMFNDKTVVRTTIDSDAGEDIQIFRIDGEIPENVVNNSYLNIFRNDKKSIHNIALYPCKFIPQLPRWAINKYSKEGDTILDPFSGGGTTLIEARKLNRNVVGFDYNPYAVLLGKVKSDLYKREVLDNKLKNLIENFLNEESDIALPEFRGVDFWFNKDVLRALSVIKKHVNGIKEKSIKDFFRVVFSMVVRKSSYVAPGPIVTGKLKINSSKFR